MKTCFTLNAFCRGTLFFCSIFWLAAGVFAQSPASIAGRTIELRISNGTFPFASVGSYRFLPSATDNAYAIVPIFGNITPSVGTYTYTKTGANTARLSFADLLFGSLTADCTYTTANSGTYALTSSLLSTAGQSGTFVLYSGTSPATIVGYTFTVTITSGQSPFANSGSYQFVPSPSGNTFQVAGSFGVGGSSGTYSYTKNSPTTGLISFIDSIVGPGFGQQLSFDTATSGTAFLRKVGASGYQTGTFVMTPTILPPSIASQPQDQTVNPGSSVVFKTVTGELWRWLI